MATKEGKKGMRGIFRILLNIAAMAVLAAAIILGLFKWMDKYTRHGEYITVPDVYGMFEDEAVRAFESAGLKCEVSDYKFDRQMVQGGIIEQSPAAGAYVKEGRVIYLTVNTGKEPVKKVPDVADNSSLRAAQSQLRTAGFVLAPTVYIDGDMDWVYEIRYNGEKIEAGTEIPEGSTLTIVAGNGNPAVIIEEADSGVFVESGFFD